MSVVRLCALALAGCLAACGGDSGGDVQPAADSGTGGSFGDGARTGNPPGPVACGTLCDTLVIDLTAADGAAICDYAAAASGGYGNVVVCLNSNTFSANASQAVCVAKMANVTFKPGCAATVQTAIQCAHDLAACASSTSPACASYLACVL